MQKLSQNDPQWKNIQLGTSDKTIGGYGCFITSLSMLAGKMPPQTNNLLKMNGGYTNGSLVNSERASEILGIEYNGKTTNAQSNTCIAETDSFRPRILQHFFVWLGNNEIIDPIDGKRKTNPYHIVSYRLFKEKINLPPMADSDKDNEIDFAFRLFLNGRATDADKVFWRPQPIATLVAQLCNSQERFDLINRIFKAITGKDANDNDQATFKTQRWSIGEITKNALERVNK